MRSAALAFLALAILANSSAANAPTPTSTTTRGEDRHYADALEDLEREMMTMMTADGGGDGGAGGPPRGADRRGGGAGRWSRSTPTTSATTTTTATTTSGLHRHRLDVVDGEHAGYKSHQLWREDRREELEGMRRRASEALVSHDEGREVLDERDLKNLARRMAALERKMRSVDAETPERYFERVERHERRILEKFERKKQRHAESFGRRRRSDKVEL